MKWKYVTVIAFAVVSMAGCVQQKEESPVVTADVTATGPVKVAASKSVAQQADPHVICGLYYDVTPSVDPAVERAAREAVAASLVSFVDHYRCSEIRFGAFADEGAFFIPRTITLQRVDDNTDCQEQLSSRDRALQFIPGALEAAEKQCRDEMGKRVNDAVEARNRQLKIVSDFLTTEVPRRGACTNLVGLLRMLDRSRSDADIDVIVSDGAESCEIEVPKLDFRHHIFLVQCPRSGNPSATGSEALARAEALGGQVEGLHVLLPAEISADFWQRVDAASRQAAVDRPQRISNSMLALRN